MLAFLSLHPRQEKVLRWLCGFKNVAENTETAVQTLELIRTRCYKSYAGVFMPVDRDA